MCLVLGDYPSPGHIKRFGCLGYCYIYRLEMASPLDHKIPGISCFHGLHHCMHVTIYSSVACYQAHTRCSMCMVVWGNANGLCKSKPLFLRNVPPPTTIIIRIPDLMHGPWSCATYSRPIALLADWFVHLLCVCTVYIIRISHLHVCTCIHVVAAPVDYSCGDHLIDEEDLNMGNGYYKRVL